MNPLETSICGIRLKNPVIAASGTFAYGVEFAEQVDLNALGGLVVTVLAFKVGLPLQAGRIDAANFSFGICRRSAGLDR